MMSAVEKNLVIGNILLVVCCVFYLAWWLIAFKPSGAIKGMASGWLLIPAAVAGLGAIFVLVQNIREADTDRQVLPGMALLVAGIAAYFVLLAVTSLCLHRVVTTELLLIVGWCVLALSEINVLYGMHDMELPGAAGWFTVIILAAAVSMICYIFYYGLDAVRGYVDGMMPLLIIAVVMMALTVKNLTKFS